MQFVIDKSNVTQFGFAMVELFKLLSHDALAATPVILAYNKECVHCVGNC